MSRGEKAHPPLSPEARALASDPAHLALARRIARLATARRRVPRDIADSGAMLGLCEAAAGFEPGRGLKFATYARHRIAGRIADDLRRWHGRPGSLHWAARLASVPAGPLREVLPEDSDPVGADAEYHDLVERVTRGLMPLERRLLRAQFTDARCATSADAARHFGVSPAWIRELRRNGLSQARANLPAAKGGTP